MHPFFCCWLYKLENFKQTSQVVNKPFSMPKKQAKKQNKIKKFLILWGG